MFKLDVMKNVSRNSEKIKLLVGTKAMFYGWQP
jgi:hypothetical protein